MSGFVIFIIFAIICLCVSKVHIQSIKDAWAPAAREFNLNFTHGRFIANPRISGTYEGCKIVVDTVSRGSGNSSSTYTRFVVHYPHPYNLGLGLQLSEEGFFSELTKFFGEEDIQTGDRVFDGNVMVKGNNPKNILRFLTPSRRVRIHRLLKSYPGSIVADSCINWEVRGTITSQGKLAQTIRYFVNIANCLAGERTEDQELQLAMEAQQEGRVDDAMSILGGLSKVYENKPSSIKPQEVQKKGRILKKKVKPAEKKVLLPPLEERVLKGELLYLGDRRREAKQIFDEALKEVPQDLEIKQLAMQASRESQEVSTDSESDIDLNVASVCKALFAEGNQSFNINDLFEKQYRAKSVRWKGKLRSVQSCSYDFVLGDEPGTKAAFEIYTVATSLYGEKNIVAIVRFQPDEIEKLNNKIGETLAFKGVLFKVDSFMKNLYLTGGEIS
jgi:hypothetical protein